MDSYNYLNQSDDLQTQKYDKIHYLEIIYLGQFFCSLPFPTYSGNSRWNPVGFRNSGWTPGGFRLDSRIPGGFGVDSSLRTVFNCYKPTMFLYLLLIQAKEGGGKGIATS
jgi:hypothetical protein